MGLGQIPILGKYYFYDAFPCGIYLFYVLNIINLEAAVDRLFTVFSCVRHFLRHPYINLTDSYSGGIIWDTHTRYLIHLGNFRR